jgi:stage V sporulation protein AE
MQNYLWVFLVGGFICFIGQILVVKTKLTPTRILVLYLTLGAILEMIGVYDFIVEIGGAGAKVPISGFGATLVKSAREQVTQHGLIGVFSGGFTGVAAGVAAAIFFSLCVALIFDSKSKNK